MENSIKDGSAENGAVRIKITGYTDGDTVRIEIKDEGKGIPEGTKGGIYANGTGLRNVNERLQKVYGEGYGLRFRDNKPMGTIAVVTILREKR